MDNKYVIITGATGGIGSQLSKLCYESNQLIGGCLLYKDEKKFISTFGNYYSDKIEKYRYNMKDVVNIDFDSNLDKIININSVSLILTSFTIEPLKKIFELSLDEITNNININILAQINIILNMVQYTKKKNINLNIINIDSGAAYHPIIGWSLYSSAKSYMNIFLKSIKLEEKLNVVTYDPGVVDTRMQEIIRNKDDNKYKFVKQFKNYYESGNLNDPYKVAVDIWNRYILNWEAENFQERFNR